MSGEKAIINWDYSSKADYLLGNGATLAERALVWVAGLIGLGIYAYFFLTGVFHWSWWQYLLAAVIAFDIFGGIVANTLNTCKRFYHTPAEPGESRFFKNHLVFSALHIYPPLAAFLFGPANTLYGVFWYIYLITSTLTILNTPLYLKRPVSFFLITLALLINIYAIPPVHGFEWLVPALFLKILYGHLVQEEPYRPFTGAAD